ncbi:hypothetical protein [Pseudomonas sp. CC120222-01a]|uniref:hypothetical protein n=1 Tax=Pseudomonas sp. CC120222-01a TaxID=1378075 RepID=UPI000D8CFA97|nr:hypothetical protein [Pseudomonas sp. CC120222-01a]PVZ43711.1 hypothetical protein N430_00184 [Pseudomonas sp. CC120222-01a]
MKDLALSPFSKRICLDVTFFLTLLLGLVLVYHLGFHAMVDRFDAAPERLRDYTFPVWGRMPWFEHGFLTFLNPDAYAQHEAYANHSTLYLIFMRGLFLLQEWVPSLPPRTTAAILAMLASLGAMWFTIRRQLAISNDGRNYLLVLAALLYFLTLPNFWISLGKFNVDNGFVFVFPVLLMTSILLERDDAKGKTFWICALSLCLVMPMAGALFSMFMLAMTLLVNPSDRHRLKVCGVLMAVSVAAYLQPVLVAKVLGFSSQNSTWLFRSGLDGDMRFFGNFIDSVVAPQFNRPWYMIALPATVLLLQFACCWRVSGAILPPPGQSDGMQGIPYAFSVYLLMLLFWPQAVSIHPYLYDALLIGPLVSWVAINFATRAVFAKHFVLWLLLFAFLIQFNLTKIAQAGHCTDCYYPAWGMLGSRAG